MKTRNARALAAAGIVLAGALLAGAHRSDPITCSVSSISVIKFIPVESMNSEPSTILRVEVEPRGPHGAVFTHRPPIVTSVTDAADKELLRPTKPMKVLTSRDGRPQTPRQELIATVRRSARPDPFQHTGPPSPFYLEAFPSTIKHLKGSVEVLSGDEVVVPVEIAEAKDAVEVSPGVTFVVTKITERDQTRFADFQIRIRKNQPGDRSAPGEEPVVVGMVQRSGDKVMNNHLHDQLSEKEEGGEYVTSSPPPLMLGYRDGTPFAWDLRLVRNIQRTKVEFECSDVIVRPQR